MTGKKALRRLYFDNEDLKVDISINDREVCEIYNIINEDLERLRQLEYVMLLIVDYGLIDIDKLENVMYYAEFEAMKKAFKEAEDKIRRSIYEK